MKRISTNQTAKRTGIIRIDLTEKQLIGIGLVAITYNEAEILIDVLLSSLLGTSPKMSLELTSRINGIDGKIELIKLGVKDLESPASFLSLLTKSLGKEGNNGFSELKKYRDGIIHARILDASLGIGLTPGKRGTIYDILLTSPALEAVAERLSIMRHELIEISNIIMKLRALVGQPKLLREQEIQQLIPLYQQHQKNRLSLAPLPEFPSESEVFQAHTQWLQTLMSGLTTSQQGDHPPYFQKKFSQALWDSQSAQAPPLPLTEALKKK